MAECKRVWDIVVGNYVKSDVKLFISQNSYIKLHFLLTDETEYNEELKNMFKVMFLILKT